MLLVQVVSDWYPAWKRRRADKKRIRAMNRLTRALTRGAISFRELASACLRLNSALTPGGNENMSVKKLN